MKDVTISEEDNLIIQSYYTVCLLNALGDKFTENTYFQDLEFNNDSIKEGLKHVTVQNQGSALMALYAMLIIPKELIGKKYHIEYERINDFLNKECFDINTTYKNDKKKINFLRHLRNAVAHANISFDPNNYMKFYDKNKKEEFNAKLSLSKMGKLLNELQNVHLKYIEDRQKAL